MDLSRPECSHPLYLSYNVNSVAATLIWANRNCIQEISSKSRKDRAYLLFSMENKKKSKSGRMAEASIFVATLIWWFMKAGDATPWKANLATVLTVSEKLKLA